MNTNCFICNVSSQASPKTTINIFDNTCGLQSGRKVPDILTEVIEKPIKVDHLHSNVVCKNCYKMCSEYDSIQVRLNVIKSNLLKDFKNTLEKIDLAYDTYGNSQISIRQPKVKYEERRIIVPASKLQPLPADFVLDVSKMASVSKCLPNRLKALTTESSTVNLRVTVGSSVLTQSVKTVMSPIIKEISSAKPTDTSNVIVTMLPTLNQNVEKINSTKNPVLSFNINSLPKDYLTSAVLTKISGNDKETNDYVIEENTDGQSMEIDEDCSLVVPVTTDDSGKLVFEIDALKNAKEKTKSNFFDMGLLLSDPNETPQPDEKDKFILDKLHVLKTDDEADGEQTLVMEDEDGTTIIRMAAGQRVLYDGTKFVVADEDEQPHDGLEVTDSQDSNEESQIELQVSGDEETANAIIAAAREQGGAFIKVESGEMYRVKSVQSKPDTADDDDMLIQTMVEEVNGQYKCLLCANNKDTDCVLLDGEVMMQHLRQQHAARLYICRECGRVLRRRAHYSAHLAEHAAGGAGGADGGGGAVRVRVPGGGAASSAGPGGHTCHLCGKTFASKYTHQAHLKTHQDRPRPFKCKECDKSFLTQQNLTQHEKTHLGIKDFICKICGKAFASQHNLEVHGVTHSGRRPFVCSVCGKGFARRPELSDHARVHTGERPFACDICGAAFSQRSNLHSHRRATHLGDKRHACTQCPKRFKRRRLLEYHVKAAHTGERPLRCGACRATFVYPEHYKKHQRVHTGEKPYVCEVCGKSFNSRDNRNTHRFVHSDKKPYECFTCAAGYMRKRQLLAHMAATGHVAESIVVNQPRVIKTIENTTMEVVDITDINGDTKYDDSILYATKETDLDVSHIGTVDKSTINLIADGNESILTLQDLKTIKVDEATLDTNVDGQTEVFVSDENGSVMKLIQIQLPDGKTGWVSINKPLEGSL